MTPNDYIDACKMALGVSSDNALAKLWKLHRQRISAYRSGQQWPDNYLVMQFAITLKLDPASVLADLESQREKKPAKLAFWRSFCSRASTLAVWLCTLALTYTATYGNAYGMDKCQGNSPEVRIIRPYVKRWLSRCARRLQEIMKTCRIPCTALAIPELAVKT